MTFNRDEFIVYAAKNTDSFLDVYDYTTSLCGIERLFDVDLDEAYSKDKCAALLKEVKREVPNKALQCYVNFRNAQAA